MTIERFESTGQRDTDEYVHLRETLSSAGATQPVRISQDIVVQISGTATAIDALLERSFTDPSGSATWAPAEDDHFYGDLSAGIAARRYFDPLQGYYRVRIISISGGNANISVLGRQAQ